jgi:hypothetical protein
MAVVNGNAQLRQAEYPGLADVAGPDGVGTGDSLSGKGEQQAAVNAKEPRCLASGYKGLGSCITLWHGLIPS